MALIEVPPRRLGPARSWRGINRTRALLRLALLALAAGAGGCCGDDSSDAPKVRIVNETPYYVHIFHPEEVFLYVPPGATVSLTQDVSAGQVTVAAAPGQGVTVKSAGKVPERPSSGDTCQPYRIGLPPFSFSGGSCTNPSSGGSCPYIYTRAADDRLVLEGEALVGAVNRGAARADALVLHAAAPGGDRTCVQVAAVLHERIAIDAAALELVDHPANTRVVLDPEGEPLVLRSLVPPAAAQDAAGARLDPGHPRWTRTLDTGGTHDSLRLRFARPTGADAVTLAVRLRNTEFIQDTYHEFLRTFGPGLPKAMRLASRFSWYRPMLDRLTRSAGLTLAVRVESEGDRLAAQIPPLGQAAPREVAIRVPLASRSTKDVVIRLEALPGAWEIDRVQATFAPPERPTARRRAAPLSARLTAVVRCTAQSIRQPPLSDGAQSRTVPLADLLHADDREVSFVQGQRLELCFPAPADPPRLASRTAVLHLTGHYEPLDDSWRPCMNLGALRRSLLTSTPTFSAFARQRLAARHRRAARVQQLEVLR